MPFSVPGTTKSSPTPLLSEEEFVDFYVRNKPDRKLRDENIAFWAAAGSPLSREQMLQEFPAEKTFWVLGISPGTHKYFSSAPMRLYLEAIKRLGLDVETGQFCLFAGIYADNFSRLFPAFTSEEAMARAKQFDGLSNPSDTYHYLPKPLNFKNWEANYQRLLSEKENNWEKAYPELLEIAANTHATYLAKEVTLPHTDIEHISKDVFGHEATIFTADNPYFENLNHPFSYLLKMVNIIFLIDPTLTEKAKNEGKSRISHDTIHQENFRKFKENLNKQTQYFNILDEGAINYAKKEIAIVLSYFLMATSNELKDTFTTAQKFLEKVQQISLEPLVDFQSKFQKIVQELFGEGKNIKAIYPQFFSDTNPLGAFVKNYLPPETFKYYHFEKKSLEAIAKVAKGKAMSSASKNVSFTMNPTLFRQSLGKSFDQFNRFLENKEMPRDLEALTTFNRAHSFPEISSSKKITSGTEKTVSMHQRRPTPPSHSEIKLPPDMQSQIPIEVLNDPKALKEYLKSLQREEVIRRAIIAVETKERRTSPQPKLPPSAKSSPQLAPVPVNKAHLRKQST